VDSFAYVSRADVAAFVAMVLLVALLACSIVAIDYWVWRRPQR
jgi:hypothetical protein